MYKKSRKCSTAVSWNFMTSCKIWNSKVFFWESIVSDTSDVVTSYFPIISNMLNWVPLQLLSFFEFLFYNQLILCLNLVTMIFLLPFFLFKAIFLFHCQQKLYGSELSTKILGNTLLCRWNNFIVLTIAVYYQ